MIPDWPHLTEDPATAAENAAAGYRQLQAILSWLDITAALIPDGRCVICATATPKLERNQCRSCYRRTSQVDNFLFLVARGVVIDVALTRVTTRPRRRPTTIRTMYRHLRALRASTSPNRAGVPPHLLQPEVPGLPLDKHDLVARLTWLAASFDVTSITLPADGLSLTAAEVAAAARATQRQVRRQLRSGQLPAARRGKGYPVRVTPLAAAAYARQRWLTGGYDTPGPAAGEAAA